MEWTDEKLKELKGFGAAFFSIKKTAFCMELDYEELKMELKNDESKAFKNYWGGFYESEVKVNKGVIDMAANGSNPAQTLAIKIAQEAKNENYE